MKKFEIEKIRRQSIVHLRRVIKDLTKIYKNYPEVAEMIGNSPIKMKNALFDIGHDISVIEDKINSILK